MVSVVGCGNMAVRKLMLHYLKSSIDICSLRLSTLILKPNVAGDGSFYKVSTSKMSKRPC